VAPDISSMKKPMGIRCRHLDDDLLCRIYGERPAVCRGYRPDGLCHLVAAQDLDERVRRYLGLFGIGSGGGS
jgi:hypothetical protein